MKYVGFSFKKCIPDIANGKVPYDKVLYLLCEEVEDEHDFHELAKSCSENEWKDNPMCVVVYDKLVKDKRLMPRGELFDEIYKPYMLRFGNWFNIENYS